MYFFNIFSNNTNNISGGIMKIKKNVKDNLKEIKKLNGNSPDFNTRYIKVKNK